MLGECLCIEMSGCLGNVHFLHVWECRVVRRVSVWWVSVQVFECLGVGGVSRYGSVWVLG